MYTSELEPRKTLGGPGLQKLLEGYNPAASRH